MAAAVAVTVTMVVTVTVTVLLCVSGIAEGASRSSVCQEDFLIRSGTIIRTVDSRRRGATFLNNTEVTETAGCLQACCDRATCNAAIHDQKTGSCFLFDCGPPDDYRCLFTAHAQFVSGTLRGSRAQLELSRWGAQSQHAAELHRLKNTDSSSASEPDEHQKTLERPLKEIIHAPATSPPPVTKAPAPRCSRFEFECHSGECLAIYNACDGIPQCVDGSDEAEQLHCPEASKSDGSEVTERPPAEASSNKGSDQRAQAAPPPRPPPEPVGQPNDDAGSGWDRPRYNQRYSEPLPPGDIFSHRQQGLLTGLSHFPATSGAGRQQHRPVVQQQLPPAPLSFPQYEKPPSLYQPPSVFYDDIYQNWAGRPAPGGYSYDALPPQRPALPDQSLPLPPSGPQINHGQVAPQAVWPQQQQQMLQQPGRETMGAVAPAAPAAAAGAEDRPLSVDRRPTPQQTSDPQTQRAPAVVAAPIASPSVQPPTEAPAEVTSAPGTAAPPAAAAASAAPPPAVDEVALSLSELRSQAALQASESQGAAIVLTLGILLSAILLVLATCRTQCGRQRGRRGDRPGLAHDADYLVNGMYL